MWSIATTIRRVTYSRPFMASCILARRRRAARWLLLTSALLQPVSRTPALPMKATSIFQQRAEVDATCRIHVAFHGCLQNHDTVGDEFVKHTGFARWADANGIVVLFPQVASGNLSNPQGCWDWWGYTGSDYLTHDAPQIEAIYSMLEKLAGSRTLGSARTRINKRLPFLLVDLIDSAGGARSSRQDEENGACRTRRARHRRDELAACAGPRRWVCDFGSSVRSPCPGGRIIRPSPVALNWRGRLY